MLRTRLSPCLLIKDGALVKSVNFKQHKYVGDPLNAVRIFNELYVDEIIILDISATKNKNYLTNFKKKLPYICGNGWQKNFIFVHIVN